MSWLVKLSYWLRNQTDVNRVHERKSHSFGTSIWKELSHRINIGLLSLEHETTTLKISWLTFYFCQFIYKTKEIVKLKFWGHWISLFFYKITSQKLSKFQKSGQNRSLIVGFFITWHRKWVESMSRRSAPVLFFTICKWLIKDMSVEWRNYGHLGWTVCRNKSRVFDTHK